eukprot:m.174825 g.174825  ORF g.174825 m.174825 type:complete len:375 (+) comp31786_c1_seq1:57-1181(+)
MSNIRPNPDIIVHKLKSSNVDFYNDEHFAKIRQRFGVPNDILREENFDFKKLSSGGGKGGDPMCRTNDKIYFVKEVKKCDHDSLLNVAESLVQQVLNGSSVVCRIVMHFHVKNHTKDYMVMNSWVPSTGNLDLWRLMDLKGTADDKTMIKDANPIEEVHKRFWKVHMNFSCCRTQDRNVYYKGKKDAFNFDFHVTKQQQSEILQAIRSDAEYFQKQGLMDYSLIAAVYKVPASEYSDARKEEIFPKLKFDERQPFIAKSGGDVYAYYLGIIDILQPWTTAKKIAHCIKCTFAPKPISTVEPVFYGDQFSSHFTKHFRGDAESVEDESRPLQVVKSTSSTSPSTSNATTQQTRTSTSTKRVSSDMTREIIYVSHV